MSDFIRVLGDDPHYKGRMAYMFIDVRLICKVYPVHAVESDGQLFRCTEGHEGAKIVSHTLIDMNGKEYSCGNAKELQKLGIDAAQTKRKIGFVGQEGQPQTSIDLG